jgi:hypothetical protein
MSEKEEKIAAGTARALQEVGLQESELWRVIPFATKYEASSLGRVKRIETGYIVQPKDSIPRVWLFGEGKKPKPFYLHRLIALTFIDNPDNCPCVRQKDGNRQNNSVSNLEWCTRSDTMQHAYDSGSKQPTRGPAIYTPLGIFGHQREAAKAAGISQTALRWRLNSERFPDWYNDVSE